MSASSLLNESVRVGVLVVATSLCMRQWWPLCSVLLGSHVAEEPPVVYGRAGNNRHQPRTITNNHPELNLPLCRMFAINTNTITHTQHPTHAHSFPHAAVPPVGVAVALLWVAAAASSSFRVVDVGAATATTGAASAVGSGRGKRKSQ